MSKEKRVGLILVKDVAKRKFGLGVMGFGAGAILGGTIGLFAFPADRFSSDMFDKWYFPGCIAVGCLTTAIGWTIEHGAVHEVMVTQAAGGYMETGFEALVDDISTSDGG